MPERRLELTDAIRARLVIVAIAAHHVAASELPPALLEQVQGELADEVLAELAQRARLHRIDRLDASIVRQPIAVTDPRHRSKRRIRA